jgi:hypothetical protein
MAIYRKNAGAQARWRKAQGIKVKKMTSAKETRNGVTTTYTMHKVDDSYEGKNGVVYDRPVFRVTSDTNPQFEKNFFTEENAMAFLNKRAGVTTGGEYDRAGTSFRKKRQAARKAKLARPNQVARRQKAGLMEAPAMSGNIVSQKDVNGKTLFYRVDASGKKSRVSAQIAAAAGVKANPGRRRNTRGAGLSKRRGRKISFHDLY